MFNRQDISDLSGLTYQQLRRLENQRVFCIDKGERNNLPYADYDYNQAIFAVIFGILRNHLKELGLNQTQLGQCFQGGLSAETDFVNADILVFTKAGFFLIPSSTEARSLCEEWLPEGELVILEPNLTSENLRMFGLNVIGGLLLGGAIFPLYKLREVLDFRCQELNLEDKLIQAKKATQTKEKNQSLAKC